MAAHREDITAEVRIQIAGKMVGSPETNRSELAQRHKLSRPSLYAISNAGRAALEQRFDPAKAPSSPGGVGFWLWVDPEAIKRAVVTLRAVLGAPLSAIVEVLLEMFRVRISESTVRSVVQQGYQRAFDYQKGMRLDGVKRAAFDEMYRWRRCILTGVDCESLFIFLGEKQPGCGKEQWLAVMGRLKEEQGLEPQEVAIDGLSALELGVRGTWKDTRLVHDIAHANIMLRKLEVQFEQRAYQAIGQAEQMQRRLEAGPTRRSSVEQLKRKLHEAKHSERLAIERATQVSCLVEQAHAALSLIDPMSGLLNDAERCKAKLRALAQEAKGFGTMQAQWTGTYLAGPAQKMVEERAEFGRVMLRLSEQQRLPFASVQSAAWLWQIYKQHQGARWSGTREKLEQQMLQCWSLLCEGIGPLAAQGLLIELFRAFREVLAASSPVEWANERLSSPLSPQKRPSSGMLHLRAAYLNLHRFIEGRRKGKSPHELLTGHKAQDWLLTLGYAPRQGKVRSLKQLGWPRLVAPFEPTWRQNWLGSSLEESLSAAADLLDAA